MHETDHDHPRTCEWAAKYLVSCLRERADPEHGAYYLSADYMDEGVDHFWLDAMFEPEVKTRILNHLLTLEKLWT